MDAKRDCGGISDGFKHGIIFQVLCPEIHEGMLVKERRWCRYKVLSYFKCVSLVCPDVQTTVLSFQGEAVLFTGINNLPKKN